jgi:alanine dehydrogenase
MLVGVPKETKDNEYRVGLVPATVRELVKKDHRVFVETGAGNGAGIQDADYIQSGAEIASDAETVFARAELIVKVKEPLAWERAMLRRGQILFTYLHLAADPQQAEDLIASGVAAIAYETVSGENHSLPLLTPMSEVAGRMAPQVGAHCLEKENGGRGVLLGGVPGVPPADVVVLGTNAALIAQGMGANVIVAGHQLDSLRRASATLGSRLRTIFAMPQTVETLCRRADLVICAVLVPGGKAPKLITAETVRAMKQGAVIVDVSIDQGGTAETSRPTTHSNPTYVVDGVVHYCVTNMPGAVARTSTFALSSATSPFVLDLASKGLRRALADDTHFAAGLNIYDGMVTHAAVAEALGRPYVPVRDALKL